MSLQSTFVASLTYCKRINYESKIKQVENCANIKIYRIRPD